MPSSFLIRPFQPADIPRLVSLLRMNTPCFFAPEEEADFLNYLDKDSEHYFVVEADNLLLGCGGYNLLPQMQLARISWDIFHPDYHGKGLGAKLVQHRISEIKAIGKFPVIQVRTSQHAYRFYEKQRFVLKATEKDFWAKGIDLYLMEMDI